MEKGEGNELDSNGLIAGEMSGENKIYNLKKKKNRICMIDDVSIWLGCQSDFSLCFVHSMIIVSKVSGGKIVSTEGKQA